MPELAPTEQLHLCGQANQPLLYETIGRCLDRIAATHPDQPALVVRHQNIRWSYAEYRQQGQRSLAMGLVAIGIDRGDRVGIWSPNRVEWCLTQFATAKIGAIMVCINPAYRPYELEYALNKVECKAVISAECFKTSEYRDASGAGARTGGMCAWRLTSCQGPSFEKHRTHGYRKDPGHVQF